MKTIILYYSYSGKTKRLANIKAKELEADIEEVIEEKKLSGFGSFFIGAPKAMSRKKTKVKPVSADLSVYEKIVIMAPVWAGHPAPAFNNIIEIIPSGKKIEVIMISAGGGTKNSRQKTIDIITAHGCEVTDYSDFKA